MAKKKNERNAGRKAKYGEPTKVVTFKLPATKIAEIKAKVYALMKEYERR